MKIVLGVSGGIAAYKTPELVRRLRDSGAAIRVILTENAARFVSPLSIAAVSEHGVITDQWGDPAHGGVDHIELARWAGLLLIAPATANVIAKLAAGIADDALTTYALAHRGPIIVAPAMNTFMLAHPSVQENIARLRGRGVDILEPDRGLLACGEEGAGRLPDPPIIIERVRAHFTDRDFDGVRILVTAGATREPIDPVRYISNRSSGKMGYAIAEEARRRGAIVTLISGTTALAPPRGVTVVPIVTASDMYDAVMHALPTSDVVIKAAAVADFSPVSVADQKIKKVEGRDELVLTLHKNRDILAAVGAAQPKKFIVAFAAETDAVESNAREKMLRKNADLIVANDVSDPSIGFDSDQNAVTILAREGEDVRIGKAPKAEIANRILDAVIARIAVLRF
jgi:phosphopantothenoylcysteine decarboxylase/phosphopantothenate--cysteine ligase